MFVQNKGQSITPYTTYQEKGSTVSSEPHWGLEASQTTYLKVLLIYVGR